ncbi:MAG: PorT family protein [Gemmatimonadetes bacterium]|nr:PorT family protein [Gemmatimonadota bacterium]
MPRSAWLLAALVLALLDQAAAQRRLGSYVRRAFDYRAVEVGIIGGPNLTSISGTEATDSEIRGTLGGFASVSLGEGFRLRPEVLITGKRVGAAPLTVIDCLPTGCPQDVARETVHLTWIEAPLLLEYRFRGPPGGLSPRLYGGPFMALRIGCSEALRLVNPSERLVRSCGEANTTGTRYNNGDGGFVLGAGLARRGVGVGVRWTRSVARVAPTPQPTGNRLVGGRQSTLTATVEFSTRVW